MYPAARCAHPKFGPHERFRVLIVLRLPNGRIGPGLNIRWSLPAKVTRTVRPAADPACSENAYSLAGPFWANTGIATDAWFYNQGTASRAGLTVAATQSDIRQANTNLTQGINNCGFPQGTFNVQGAFQGRSRLRPCPCRSEWRRRSHVKMLNS
jgi:hypothetical protein